MILYTYTSSPGGALRARAPIAHPALTPDAGRLEAQGSDSPRRREAAQQHAADASRRESIYSILSHLFVRRRAESASADSPPRAEHLTRGG